MRWDQANRYPLPVNMMAELGGWTNKPRAHRHYFYVPCLCQRDNLAVEKGVGLVDQADERMGAHDGVGVIKPEGISGMARRSDGSVTRIRRRPVQRTGTFFSSPTVYTGFRYSRFSSSSRLSSCFCTSAYAGSS